MTTFQDEMLKYQKKLRTYIEELNKRYETNSATVKDIELVCELMNDLTDVINRFVDRMEKEET
jgi:Mg2+ and Co2+ transporter CorA